jgi:hypothetical protein
MVIGLILTTEAQSKMGVHRAGINRFSIWETFILCVLCVLCDLCDLCGKEEAEPIAKA